MGRGHIMGRFSHSASVNYISYLSLQIFTSIKQSVKEFSFISYFLFSHHLCFACSSPYHILPASYLSYPYPPLQTFTSFLRSGLLNQRLYMIRQYFWGSDRECRGVCLLRVWKHSNHRNYEKIRSKKRKRII